MIDTDKYYYTDRSGKELFNNSRFYEKYKDRCKRKGTPDGVIYFSLEKSILGDIVWQLEIKAIKRLIDHWLDYEQDTVDEGTDYTEHFKQLEEGLFYVLILAENTPADYGKQWERVTRLLTMTPHERAEVIEDKRMWDDEE